MGSLRSWSSRRFVAVDDKEGDGSSKHLTDFEVNDNEVKPLSRYGSSASSSSSNSSRDLVNVLGNDGNDNRPLEKSEQPELKSPAPFRVSSVSSNKLSPENHMPAGQVPGGYLPNRIPSSVFSGKPATPMDWSTASNESLFSIHVGNGSFSKDQLFMLYKSGELTELDEQIIAQGDLLPPLKELQDMATRNENIDKDSGDHNHQKMPPAEEVHNPISNTPTVELSAVPGNYTQEKNSPAKVHNSPTKSISGRSDGSNNSTHSFAFPLLTGTSDAGRFSPVNGDQNNKGLQIRSVKQQEQSTRELQPQTPVTHQNACIRSWFSWFYCCRCS
ncbi:hypothetical protein CRYUN_Cryun15aG0042000 [Craigia yunnanensis]